MISSKLADLSLVLFVIRNRYHCNTVGADGDSLDRGLVEIHAVASLDAGSALLSQLAFLLHHLLHSLAAFVVGCWLHGEGLSHDIHVGGTDALAVRAALAPG